MASAKKSKEGEQEKKKKNKAAATPSKETPIKKKPSKQDKDKKKKNNNKKKADNGRVSESAEVYSIPSSCDSQESQDETGEEHAKTSQSKNHSSKSSKPKKNNKRKERAVYDEEEEGDGTMCRFPMARIKRIMKIEDPSLQLTQDVVFLVNKATEKFIEQFCEEAFECSVRDRKKSLGYKHLSSVVNEQRRFDFLSDFVPERLKAEDALAQRKLVEKGQA